jgi:hypothetical protein
MAEKREGKPGTTKESDVMSGNLRKKGTVINR